MGSVPPLQRPKGQGKGKQVLASKQVQIHHTQKSNEDAGRRDFEGHHRRNPKGPDAQGAQAAQNVQKAHEALPEKENPAAQVAEETETVQAQVRLDPLRQANHLLFERQEPPDRREYRQIQNPVFEDFEPKLAGLLQEEGVEGLQNKVAVEAAFSKVSVHFQKEKLGKFFETVGRGQLDLHKAEEQFCWQKVQVFIFDH